MRGAFFQLPPVLFVRDMVQTYGRLGVSRAAASLAYFLILTLFPLLVCVNFFIGLLELDPDFRLCDEGEAGILMLRALNDVLDRRYEDIAEGSDFARLVDTMSAGRDDSRLMQIVLDIRGRVQAHPNPAA